MAGNPVGALACLTGVPANKRAVIGPGTRLPAAVAVVLARRIDEAGPAKEITAERCAAASSLLLVRFGYPSGPVDVRVSVACAAGHVAYVHDRAYLLPSVLADYLLGATDPSGGGLAPDLIGEPLTRAVTSARLAGDTVELEGQLIDESAAGTVLLQSPTLDHQIAVIVAVHRSTPCRAGQLAIQYLPGNAGAGNDAGTILVRNVSDSWCELDGPAAITGLSAGDAVTATLRVPVPAALELSPHAVAAVPSRALPVDQLAASMLLSAAYRDDQDGSECIPHRVVPTTWRVELGSVTLAVANGRATADASPPGAGGLITCRGRFGARVRTATS